MSLRTEASPNWTTQPYDYDKGPFLGQGRVMKLKRSDLVTTTALAVVYFGAAKLGLRFALVHPSATALWAPTGIALAAFLILGFRVWPAVFLGAFLANLTTAGTVLTSLGIAAGNT